MRHPVRILLVCLTLLALAGTSRAEPPAPAPAAAMAPRLVVFEAFMRAT